MSGPYVTRDYEIAAQLEATYNTDPGSWAGAMFFKSHTEFPFKKKKSRYNRDQDKDNAQRSITSLPQGGRESGEFSITGNIIPAGAGTPTKPDMDLLFEAHLGGQHLATAHTTTGAGSSGTTLELTAGGGAASGIAAKDLIMVDVDATLGYQVRQVVSISTDTVTVDRAFGANPGSGRAVKVGWTAFLSTAALKSLFLCQWLNGNTFRHALGGAIAQMMEFDFDYNQENPVGTVTFSGPGARVNTHSNSRPTPVTVGQPLIPSQGKVWVGTTLVDMVKAGIKSNNGLELLESESGSLYPTAVKETGNNGRFAVDATLDLLLRTGGTDAEDWYDAAVSLGALDVIVQHGITPGATFAYRLPRFVPDADVSSVAGLAAISFAGKCYGGGGVGGVDDEITVAFL